MRISRTDTSRLFGARRRQGQTLEPDLGQTNAGFDNAQGKPRSALYLTAHDPNGRCTPTRENHKAHTMKRQQIPPRTSQRVRNGPGPCPAPRPMRCLRPAFDDVDTSGTPGPRRQSSGFGVAKPHSGRIAAGNPPGYGQQRRLSSGPSQWAQFTGQRRGNKPFPEGIKPP